VSSKTQASRAGISVADAETPHRDLTGHRESAEPRESTGPGDLAGHRDSTENRDSAEHRDAIEHRDQNEPPVFGRIGVVGLGLIGGSIARAVRHRWPSAHVTGVDRPDVLSHASRLGVVDVCSTELELLGDADLVILAAPVRVNRMLLSQLGERLKPTTLVTDTGSTKRDIMQVAATVEGRLTFIGGHPLGGASTAGLEHARPDLFHGRPWLFTPAADAPRAAVERLMMFASALGAAPTVLSADEHDRLLASLSHLPQLVVSALMKVVGDAVGSDGLALAGNGLIDTTRLASSPPEIWRDIAAANADQIGASLDALITELQALRADLSDGTHLTEVFGAAGQWRARLPARTRL
jgi:prephenate dehydrogenase